MVTRLLALAVLVVLAGASGYELAVALGWLEVGPEPGQGPAGEGVVLTLALTAICTGAFVCWLRMLRPERASGLELLIAPGAAMFVVTRFYTYDPYYAPALRRISEDGFIPAWWVFALAALALFAAILARARTRPGMSLALVVLVLSAFTALFERAGH
ncbi:MAG: hypothetical protein ACRDM8_10150 [Gaiellaceae bacterium]